MRTFAKAATATLRTSDALLISAASLGLLEEGTMKVELTERDANLVLACLNARREEMRQMVRMAGGVAERALEPVARHVDEVKTKLVNAWQADD
jgi:hypothetical protein